MNKDDEERPGESPAPTFDGDWQRLWVSTMERPWLALAVVPSERGIDAGSIAEQLAATGTEMGGQTVRVLSAMGARFAGVQSFIELLNSMTSAGTLVIVPVDPLADNPATIPVVKATSGALVVARIGSTRLSAARQTVEAIGRTRVFGSLVIL